ncbi:SDR family oxidoreductase [Halioxenophilus sp. WMMB6]|uniref:SDR family oxidoreductase n=1 Tax=Halioxenophilus sp. WMMB6 TaxID=3073815 RepID=UPI00295E5C2C|nr:SDR family oxidoreductase [Halioxenophilus sp. WMMB6]
MKDLVVITGGAGGMGFATAKRLGRDHSIIISDINPTRLQQAAEELLALGIDCDAVVTDIADRQSVAQLAEHAAAKGNVLAVVHTAGISPQMADAKTIIEVNAVGTVYLNEAFLALAKPGLVMVNVASMAGHMVPNLLLPKKAYRLANSDLNAFRKKLLFRCNLMPKEFYRLGMAYSVSKNFVIWYSQNQAAKFGAKGARILSVSPGTFDTEMGRLEAKSGSMEMLKTAALQRAGTSEEMAELLAFCACGNATYLTGTDILMDGGVVAGRG